MNTEFLNKYFAGFIAVDYLETVAKRLAWLMRWCGESPISVLLHSLMVAERVRHSAELKELPPYEKWCSILHALMHDAHEAVIADIPKPVAKWINDNHENCIQKIKKDVDLYLYEKCLLGLSHSLFLSVYAQDIPTVKADEEVLDFERKWLREGTICWKRLPSQYEINIRIEDLIRKVIRNRRTGCFADVRSKEKGDNPYNWCDPNALQLMWQEYVRVAIRKINETYPDWRRQQEGVM